MGEFVWGKKMVEGMMAAPSSSRHIQNDCVHKKLKGFIFSLIYSNC
jgi:hypothetical protein